MCARVHVCACVFARAHVARTRDLLLLQLLEKDRPHRAAIVLHPTPKFITASVY